MQILPMNFILYKGYCLQSPLLQCNLQLLYNLQYFWPPGVAGGPCNVAQLHCMRLEVAYCLDKYKGLLKANCFFKKCLENTKAKKGQQQQRDEHLGNIRDCPSQIMEKEDGSPLPAAFLRGFLISNHIFRDLFLL